MTCFVTGTDTGVGKTTVTAALVTELRLRGRPARALKPIETGWDEPTSDAAVLARASGTSVDETCRYRFPHPRSPRAAAAAVDRAIAPLELLAWCQAQVGAPLFIEGAGGWEVPIAGRWRMSDLAVALGARVLIVGRAGLGTVNHSILTIDAVQRRAPFAGLILSRRADDDLAFARENAAEIADQTGAQVAIYPDDMVALPPWLDVT